MQLAEYYYPNGQRELREFYRDGKLEGEHKAWHENGQLINRLVYRDGKIEGKYIAWYNRGGHPSIISNFRAGLVEGEARGWDINGLLYWSHWRRNGDVIDHKFTSQKRRAWLKLKRILIRLMRDKQTMNSFLISDLKNLLET